MKTLLGILGILITAFLFGGMISLYNWNSQTTGVWFAILMIVVSFVALVANIIHFFNLWEKIKKLF